MLKKENIHQDYTTYSAGYQLSLTMDIQVYIAPHDPVRLLNQLLEGLDYKKLLSTYSDQGRNSVVPPVIMFKILVYAYMNRAFSSREIQRLCQRDIHFIWLLNGYPAPSHHTINRFRKHHLSDGILEDLFDQWIERLHALDEIHFKNLFIDGTKIEANANKYTWVWKKSCTRNRLKVFGYVSELIDEMNSQVLNNYGLKIVGLGFKGFKPVAVLIKQLDCCKGAEGFQIISGQIGKGTPVFRFQGVYHFSENIVNRHNYK